MLPFSLSQECVLILHQALKLVLLVDWGDLLIKIFGFKVTEENLFLVRVDNCFLFHGLYMGEKKN